MKRTFCLLLALLLTVTPLLGGFALPAVAEDEPTSVEAATYSYAPGLAVWYDGVQNTRAGQDTDSTVWEDLIGDKDMSLTTNDKNHFTEEGFALDSSRQFFPQGVVDIVNGDAFTVEIRMGEFISLGANYNTFMNSSNDNFALFRRLSDDNLCFKWAAVAEGLRPKTDKALERLQNALVTLTYQVDGEVAMYVNGVLLSAMDCTTAMGANDLFIGHVDAKAFKTVYKSLRFYERALSAAEVKRNAAVDGYVDVKSLYVEDGLVALYSGISNTHEGYNPNADKWEDLAGKNDITITQNENNYFTPEGFHLDTAQYNFPQAVVDTVNGKTFTVEMYLGDLISKGQSFNTFINSSDDRFSLYRQVSNDSLMFKFAGNNASERPTVSDGMSLFANSLITITYEVGGKTIIYANGMQVAEKNSPVAMGAKDLYFGHNDAKHKNYETIFRSIRFYDRVLSAEEVMENAKADGVIKADRPISPGYVSIAQPKTNISGDVALVRRVNSAKELTEVMNAEIKPAAVILMVDSSLRILDGNGKIMSTLADVLEALNYTVMPVFELKDAATIAPLVEYLNSIRFSDCFFMSKDPSVVKAARTAMPNARSVIDYTETYKDKNGLTKEECLELRKSIKSNNGTVALLPQSAARRETVQYLYDSIVNVWVQQDVEGAAGQYDALLSGAIGVVSDDTAALYAAATALPQDTMTRVPLNIGHRGLPNGNPENTIEGALIAYEAGADVIELDVYITTDGHVVVMHDPTTGRTCDKNLNVANSTLAELKELYVNRGFENNKDKNTWRIPTLDEFLEAFKGLDCRLFIEIKSEDTRLVPAIRDLVNKHDMYDQCAVITFSTTHMRLMREQWPEMSVGALCSGMLGESDSDSGMRSVMAFIGKYNATLNPQNFGYGENAVRAALIRGIGVYPWTFEGSNYNNYFKWGYSGLTGNTATSLRNFTKSLSMTGAENGATVKVGESLSLTISAETYARKSSTVTKSAELVFVEGADLVIWEDGIMTFKAAGDVTFYATYVNSRASKQVVALQPITLHVEGGEPEVVTRPDTEPATEPGAVTEPDTTADETAAPETGADATAAETSSELSSETAAEKSDDGCASGLSGAAILLAVPAVLVALKRKKED